MKKKYSLLFRTAGGSTSNRELGLGHVFRCINLAKSLKGNRIKFLIEDYGSVKKILNNNGFSDISVVKSGITLKDDISSTLKIIKKERIHMLIVDKYKTNMRYTSEIKKKLPVTYISDLNVTKNPCNLLVNGFIGFENNIINKSNQRLLLGPKFQIIDSRFLQPKKMKTKFDVLATFGGSDESRIIEYFLESLQHVSKKLKIKCILGPSTKNSKKIQLLKENNFHQITIISQTNNMKKEIEDCAFGLCSGGITSYEFAALKVPFAILAQNKHQLITSKEWAKRRVSISIGLSNKKNQHHLIDLLEKISQGKIPKFSKQNFVDGNGVQRVVKNIGSILNKNY